MKRQYSAIPWKQISGFRNILVHNHLGQIDSETIVLVLNQHLPALKAAVRAMLDGSRAKDL
ncbi:MAG: DUF86 domain-containing protein [Nitrosospira sp.]|nr:DUF86 domain-containing protein [Nitrosospira sp.]